MKINMRTKIHELRIARGLSRAALAKTIGVSAKTIASWESGKTIPNGEKIICLSKFFNVRADYLLGAD